MTQISRQRSITAFFTLAIFAAVFANFAVAQNFKEVYPGVEYARVSRVIDGKSVNFNLLRLDLNKVRLDVVHAMDAAIGTETTSSLAKRHNAVAAINAGFFRLDNSIFAGDAAGVLMIDGKLLSESFKDRTALMISNTKEGSEVTIRRLSVYPELSFRKKITTISGIDRERKADEIIAYTPEFNTTTLTENSGVEVVVRHNRITAILDGTWNTKIPCDGFVLSATGTARTRLLSQVKVGQWASIAVSVMRRLSVGSGIWISMGLYGKKDLEMTNGVPRLIRDGKIDITWKEEKSSKEFAETRHPRTAVANLKDGKFLMLTADGRSESSGGIDLYDLADFLLELGAVDALNLDGGGSTTMVLDGKVVNHPSDKGGERKIGDALIVTLRK